MLSKFKDKQTGVLSSSDLKTGGGKVIYWFSFIVLLGVCVTAIVPAFWTICTAFKDTQEIYNSFSFFPSDVSWNRIVSRISESWKTLALGKSIFNTIVLSIGELFFTILVTGFGGFALSKLKPKGSKLIFILVIWTMMMPGQIRLVPNYISWLHFPFAYDIGGVSILDTYLPMWIGAASSAFNVILFKNAFDGLSNSYVEAAKIDGCSDFGIFFKILLPLTMPVIIYISIMTLSASWSDFFTPMLVLDTKMTVPVMIYKLKASSSIQMNTYFMSLVFASIPPFLIFALFQKHIMGGINVGGVKG